MHGTMRGAAVAVLAGALVALSVTPAATAPRPPAGTVTTGAATSTVTSAATTDRITTSASGEQADGDAFGPQLSADGRFAVFTTSAANLVPGDTNHFSDVFVRDLRKGTGGTRLVSESVNGGPVTDFAVSVSSVGADARYVGLSSESSQLVRGDTNGHYDGFVRRLR